MIIGIYCIFSYSPDVEHAIIITVVIVGCVCLGLLALCLTCYGCKLYHNDKCLRCCYGVPDIRSTPSGLSRVRSRVSSYTCSAVAREGPSSPATMTQAEYQSRFYFFGRRLPQTLSQASDAEMLILTPPPPYDASFTFDNHGPQVNYTQSETNSSLESDSSEMPPPYPGPNIPQSED